MLRFSPQREERPEKGSIYQYRKFLVRLSEDIEARFPGGDVPVMGIYLGWRGTVSNRPLIREASVYKILGSYPRAVL